ncbi:MAG: hypothetical protein NVSMB51_06090 [Solirubrobacteraceae bacterium]
MEKVQALVTAHPAMGARVLILFAAFASFVFSVVLWFSGEQQQGIFVGLWVPSILSLGGIVLRHGER